MRYAEGVFIGHRHYERAGIAPLFPFGHGLSYARIELTDFAADTTGPAEAAVTAGLKNVSDRPGSTVLQIYVRPPAAAVPRPDKELRAFAKVTLAPGETVRIERTLRPRDFAWFDSDARLWRVDAGKAEVLAGFCASDIRSAATVTIDGPMSFPP